MINGIQVTKLNSYESKFEKKIAEKRKSEMKYLRRELFIWGWTLIFTVVSPIFATGATFIIYTAIDGDNILTAADTFTTLLLFSALRFPINNAGRLVGRLGQSLQACMRISEFLARDTHRSNSNSFDASSQSELVSLKNCAFHIYSDLSKKKNDKKKEGDDGHMQEPAFSLTDIDLSLSRGSILAVVGSVGSGKSTLALSLLKEIPCSSDSTLNVRGRIGYSSQLPFILNASFRENILFGNPYEPDRYKQVIHACCLQSDIDLLQAGDLTEIGERGVTLSGGQKQRLSIARTVYSNPDVAIFDDPLSALDAGTSRAVCERLFLSKKKNDLLGSTAVVLVTHSAYFLHQMDRILVLDSGKNIFHGSWDQLITNDDAHKSEFVQSLTRDVQEKGIGDEKKETDLNTSKRNAVGGFSKSNTRGAELMTIEEREFGISSLSTWKVWFQGAGGWFFALFQVLLLAMDRTAYVATEWWVANWTDAANGPIVVLGKELPSQLDGRMAQIEYMKIYCIIIFVSFISTALRTIWAGKYLL